MTEANATCHVCQKPFLQFRSTQTVCGFKCSTKIGRIARETQKAERRETRAKLEQMKPRSKWLSEAQAAFNAFIRARDAALPCVSCGKAASAPGSWDAGHYLTVGARPELRFTEANCHRQCVKCNQHLHGNVLAYRFGLIVRIGLEAVEGLEGPHDTAKWSVDELRAIKAMYVRRIRELVARGEALAAVGVEK